MSKLSQGIKTAKESAAQSTAAARVKAGKAIQAGRGAATKGVNSTRDLANKAAIKTGESIDNNPLAIVLGGIAFGAIVGALLPKTDSEIKMLGKAGKKLNKKAKKMAVAAKDAGKHKVDSLGLNSDAILEQFRELVNKAGEALKAAGEAATDAAKKND